ncbi:hydroxyphenylacetyl-CoA thioesterase PaaI [Alphaproteobacteria bacterium]|jgi:acyl-CoA thioesterase|nr:hydroxyphenylacetyl-CoA thioesterase PaaI [Alphaproteobacteria bacterium]
METTTPAAADELALRVAEKMIGNCGLSQSLGMRLVSATQNHCVVEMALGDNHLNGFDICHGGAIFALADTAFAHACNSDNIVTVAQQCQVHFLRPGQRGDVLRATASRRDGAGRTGIYDIAITNQDDKLIAEFRGMSRKLTDPVL